MFYNEPEGASLYKKIADEICTNILTGAYQPGDRLPSIRDLSQHWDCTPGTIQRAFRELAQQGLVISQAGKGTHVTRRVNYEEIEASAPLRKARLVHRAELFILEALLAGYSKEEIEESLKLARRYAET